MHQDSTTLFLQLLWISVAILAGGYARTRNRSAWNWFLLTLIFGPLSLMLLVTWPPKDKRE